MRINTRVCSGDSAGLGYWCNIDGDYPRDAFYEWSEIEIFCASVECDFGCWSVSNCNVATPS